MFYPTKVLHDNLKRSLLLEEANVQLEIGVN